MVRYDISVYDANQKKLCTQLDTTYATEGEQSDVSISQEMSGWKELTFDIPWVVGKEKNFRMDFLKNENTIRVIRNSDVSGTYEDWFLIREPEDAHNGKTKELTVSCEHISSELKTKNLYVYFDDTNGIDTIGNLVSKALHGSGWTQGLCDTLYEADGTTEKVRSYSCDEKTGAYNMVTGICDLFMAYPTFNGADKTVDIHAISNKTGNMEFNYGKNIDSLHRSPNSTDIVTRLYVEGDYSDLGYVGIEDVNPTGLGYIMNFDYYKETGAFTDAHQAALDTYIETAKQQKTQIETTSASMLDKETRLSELWGTGKYVLYSVSNGQATAQYLGNGAEQEDAAFKEDDLVVAVKNGGEYSYVTASAGMTFGTDIVYAVKFLTPSVGQIGGKEVAIEAKETTIETLTEAKEEADSEKEKAELQNQINTTQQEINNLKNGTAESEGSYALMWEAVTTVLEIKTLDATVKSAQEDMAEAEQTFVDAMGNMLHDGYWNNSNYTVGQEESLYADAVEILKIMSRPTVTYSISFLNLAALSDYKMEEIKLNMRVRIYDFELGINDWGFIEKIVEYPLAERENTVTISTDELNIAANTFESVLNRMMEAANIIDQRNAIYERAAAISEGGTISADQLNGEIDLLKNHLASTKSGWYTDANGNIMFEAQDGQSAMMLSGSGFMVANGKDASGNWNWRTFGTGEGFTADLITAGILRAGTITILGTDQFYWDADNIYIFDPSNPDRQIRIGKYDGTNYGIGYTKDNGDTWLNAIGFDGVTQSTTTTATIESAQATADSALAAANAAQTAAGNAQSTADSAQSAASANATDLANYITSNNTEIENLQRQIDGAITTWFYKVPPTNDNPPANQWTTTDMKNIHLGDLYYDTITGYCYRWQVQNNQYSWQRITDTDVTKALEDAAEAQDTADAKRRVFVTQPTPPYDVGDLWVQGATGDILRCNTAKTAQQSFSSSDWVLASKYTDNTVANAAQEAAENAQNTANNAQAAADENAEAIAGLGTRVTTVEQKVTPDAIVQTVTQSETYQNEIGGLDQRISTAESKLTPEAMETTIENSEALSEVRQTAGKINWIVESGTSSSNMTLTDDALNVISDGITLTADKINLVANDINLSGNSSVNTIVSNVIDPLETDIDSLTTRVTQAETSITQNAEQIELRATKTEVQTVATAASNAQSAADAAQSAATGAQGTANAAQSAASAAQTAADNAASAAQTAQGAADAAQSTADAAQSAADSAQEGADFATPYISAEPPETAPAAGKMWVDTGVTPEVWRRWRGADVPTAREYQETATGDDGAAFVSLNNGAGQIESVAVEAGCRAKQAGNGQRRNLLKNTQAFTGVSGSSELTGETYNGFAVRSGSSVNISSGLTDIVHWNNATDTELGKTYTFSFWAKGSGKLYAYFYGSVDNQPIIVTSISSQGVSVARADGEIFFTLSANWERYWVKWTISGAGDMTNPKKHVLLRLFKVDSATVSVCGAQLEEGSTATDWTPAPGDYAPITGHESVEIAACGKNLYDVSDKASFTDGVTVDADGWITVTADNSAGSGILSKNCYTYPSLAIRPSTQYAVVCEIAQIDVSSGSLSFRIANTYVDMWLSQFAQAFSLEVNENTQTGTRIQVLTSRADLSDAGSMLRTYVAFLPGASGTIKFRLSVLADTAITAETLVYEPYRSMGGGTVTPSEPLYGLPDAEDTVEVSVDGDVLVTRRTGVLELDGTEGWVYSTADDYLRFGTGSLQPNISSPSAGICSHYSFLSQASSTKDNFVTIYSNGWIDIVDHRFTDAADFEAYLAAQKAAGTPVTIVYELATPTTETEALTAISPIAPQPGQLNLATDADALTATIHGSGWETVNDTSSIQDALANLDGDLASLINEVGLLNGEVGSIAQQIISPDGIKNIVFESSEYQAMANTVELNANELSVTQATVTDINGRVETIEGTVRISGSNIDIGRSDSNVQLHLDNTGWSISEGGQETIYARQNRVVAPRFQTTSLIFGALAFNSSGGHFRLMKYGG